MASCEIRFINESGDPCSVVIFRPDPRLDGGVLAWRVIENAAPGYQERFVFPGAILGADVLGGVVPGQVIDDGALSEAAASFPLDGIAAADLVLGGSGESLAFSLRNVRDA
ncbi:MAG TPA: hypothetical protein VFJ82_17710 [Longimicrobium sp.]|nr:hypothetical protein [Longimicrobium sp.]